MSAILGPSPASAYEPAVGIGRRVRNGWPRLRTVPAPPDRATLHLDSRSVRSEPGCCGHARNQVLQSKYSIFWRLAGSGRHCFWQISARMMRALPVCEGTRHGARVDLGGDAGRASWPLARAGRVGYSDARRPVKTWAAELPWEGV